MKNFFMVFCAIIMLFGANTSVKASELIVNGGFETGDFSGWIRNDMGSGSFYVTNTMIAPVSGQPTVGSSTDSYCAISDQTGPGTHAISQLFSINSVGAQYQLSFDMFVNSYGGNIVGSGELNHNISSPVEFGRVDILSSLEFASNPFSTNVIRNLYIGSDAGSNPHAYTSYNFDLSNELSQPGTYVLRFAEADNQSYFNMGIDNIKMTPTPIPAAIWIFGSGIAGLAGLRRRKKNRG